MSFLCIPSHTNNSKCKNRLILMTYCHVRLGNSFYTTEKLTLTSYHFMDAIRKSKTHGSETKSFIAHITGSTVGMFALTYSKS